MRFSIKGGKCVLSYCSCFLLTLLEWENRQRRTKQLLGVITEIFSFLCFSTGIKRELWARSSTENLPNVYFVALARAGWPSEARGAAGQPWVTARLLASAGLVIAKNQPIPWHHWHLSVKCQICWEISHCLFFFFFFIYKLTSSTTLYHPMLWLTIGLRKIGVCSDNFKELLFSFLFFFFYLNRAPLPASQVLDGSKAKHSCGAEPLSLQF